MKEINPYGLYNRNELAELLEVTPRTISAYYAKRGLPKKPGIRGNCTTGRQVIAWIENGGIEEQVHNLTNSKLVKFRNASGMH